MAINRKLNITVTFVATHSTINDPPKPPQSSYGGAATYVQTGSTPDMGNIVDADGTIHLDKAADYDPKVYNNNVDIEFTLATPAKVTPDNSTTPLAWATEYGAGMTVKPPPGGKLNEMGIHFNSTKPNVITINDLDDDNNTYNYKPAIELILSPTWRYFISLDPRIVNRARPNK